MVVILHHLIFYVVCVRKEIIKGCAKCLKSLHYIPRPLENFFYFYTPRVVKRKGPEGPFQCLLLIV